MTRPRGGIIASTPPAWSNTSTSGVFTLREAQELRGLGTWPRGPAAPTGLAVTAGNNQLSLAWTAPTVTHGTITNYLVEATPAGATAIYVLTGSTSTSYTLTGLPNGTAYTVRVAAVNHTAGDYSNNATATPGVPTDPFFSSVALLLHMNGANGSTTFPDSSATPKTVTANGGAAISTAQSMFGGASGSFSGTNQYLTIASSALQFAASNFTIEAFVYLRSLQTGFRTFWAHRASGSVIGGAVLVHSGGALQLFVANHDASSWSISGHSTGLQVNANQWYHLALVRDGGTMRTFLDGAPGTTVSMSGAIGTSSNFSLMAGAADGAQAVDGFLDEVRITAVARYTQPFSRPTAPFPDA